MFISQAQYISQCMTEIKRELKQENMGIKANAISKLTYVRVAVGVLYVIGV